MLSGRDVFADWQGLWTGRDGAPGRGLVACGEARMGRWVRSGLRAVASRGGGGGSIYVAGRLCGGTTQRGRSRAGTVVDPCRSAFAGPAMTDQQFLTVEQVAQEFQLTSQTIRNWNWGCGPLRAKPDAPLSRRERAAVRVAPAATLQRFLLAVRFAVELRLDAPRFAAELVSQPAWRRRLSVRSFCSRSRSRSTALFIFSRSRRASRSSLATSLRRSLPPVRTLPRIAPSSFSVASSAVLMRAIARPFCSKRARAAALTRAPAAGFWAAALREDDALRVAVFRALAFLIGGIDAPCLGNYRTLCCRASHNSRRASRGRRRCRVVDRSGEVGQHIQDTRPALDPAANLGVRPEHGRDRHRESNGLFPLVLRRPNGRCRPTGRAIGSRQRGGHFDPLLFLPQHAHARGGRRGRMSAFRELDESRQHRPRLGTCPLAGYGGSAHTVGDEGRSREVRLPSERAATTRARRSR